jgi:DNA mismatch repair ATPase MutS
MVYSEKLVKSYRALHQESLDCLLLMQVGAFMQVMDEDARAVATVTGLKLQMAGDVDAPVVLGGFPKSGLDAYVGKPKRSYATSADTSQPLDWMSRRSTLHS